MRRQGEQGATLLEVLVATLLLMITGAGILANMLYSMQTSKFIEANHAASSLAADRMEQLAAVDILDLNSAYNEDNVAVTWPGLDLDFVRTTVVTTNSDGSRTAVVNVRTIHFAMPTSVTFQDNFYAW